MQCDLWMFVVGGVVVGCYVQYLGCEWVVVIDVCVLCLFGGIYQVGGYGGIMKNVLQVFDWFVGIDWNIVGFGFVYGQYCYDQID